MGICTDIQVMFMVIRYASVSFHDCFNAVLVDCNNTLQVSTFTHRRYLFKLFLYDPIL